METRTYSAEEDALPAPGEEFQKWEGNFYNLFSHEAFTQLIKPGTAIVIDDVEDKDIGSMMYMS